MVLEGVRDTAQVKFPLVVRHHNAADIVTLIVDDLESPDLCDNVSRLNQHK